MGSAASAPCDAGKRHNLLSPTRGLNMFAIHRQTPFAFPCLGGLLALVMLAVPAPAGAAETAPTIRTKAQIDALVDQAGRSKPDWWEKTPLDYPQTLDLSWPDRPQGPWNARKNVSQYMWSVINENAGRWQSGTKFMHFMLARNKNNPRVLGQAIGQLAHCYQDLLRDWPRAAFWRRMQVQKDPSNLNAHVRLAECYWKMGNKTMAEAQIAKTGQYIVPGTIKLWADMGELTKALAVADALAKYYPSMAYLAAGDACRLHGKYDQAVTYYQKVLPLTASGREGMRLGIYKTRARAAIEVVKQFEALDVKRVSDGVHKGTAMSYAGPLDVAVTVRGGKILSVKVTRHRDKQYLSAITETPARIVATQGVKGVDAVTGATVTSNAIITATARALAAASR